MKYLISIPIKRLNYIVYSDILQKYNKDLIILKILYHFWIYNYYVSFSSSYLLNRIRTIFPLITLHHFLEGSIKTLRAKEFNPVSRRKLMYLFVLWIKTTPFITHSSSATKVIHEYISSSSSYTYLGRNGSFVIGYVYLSFPRSTFKGVFLDVKHPY